MNNLLDWFTGTGARIADHFVTITHFPAISVGVTVVALVGIGVTVYRDRRSR